MQFSKTMNEKSFETFCSQNCSGENLQFSKFFKKFMESHAPGRLRDGPGRPGRPREAPGGPCWKPRKSAMVPGSPGKHQNFPGRLRAGPGRHRETPGGPCWKLRKPGMAPGSSGKLRNAPEGHFARPARTTSTTQVQLVPELVGRATHLVQLKKIKEGENNSFT